MKDAAIYQIRVRGHLSPQWSQWFSGLTVNMLANGETLLCGVLPDQAAVHGVLARIRDTGLVLLALNRQETSQEGDQQSNAWQTTARSECLR